MPAASATDTGAVTLIDAGPPTAAVPPDRPSGPPGAPPTAPLSAADRAQATASARAIVAAVQDAVRGVPVAVATAVTVLVAGGHLLVEDVPGTGKTLLARAISRCVDGSFRRIQATPDLTAGEITGSGIWDGTAGRFTFVPGPVFGNVVLVDELNRTSPRTHAALMEAMDEGAVTVDGERHPLPDPMLLIATQNPVDQHGTFPLPEGQLDRFMVAMSLGYVDAQTERELVREQLLSAPVDRLSPVVDVAGLRAMRLHARATHISDGVLDHAVAVSRGTRTHRAVRLGASARATVALVRCAQGRALLAGRDFVTPDDVKALAVPVLAHRLVVHGGERAVAAQAVADVVAATPVPLS